MRWDEAPDYAAGTDHATGDESHVSRRDRRLGFLDEKWLTPIQVARKFGYATDKPIRKAIVRGELKATQTPCRRKLVVAESEVQRWIDGDLAYEPRIIDSKPAVIAVRSPSRRSRRSAMPSLSYDATRKA